MVNQLRPLNFASASVFIDIIGSVQLLAWFNFQSMLPTKFRSEQSFIVPTGIWKRSELILAMVVMKLTDNSDAETQR